MNEWLYRARVKVNSCSVYKSWKDIKYCNLLYKVECFIEVSATDKNGNLTCEVIHGNLTCEIIASS